MVKILNIALYIIFILIPALYFIWLLKHEHLIFKTFVVVMAILSTIGILLKFNFKPYNHIFTMFILVCQFLTMYIYILFICLNCKMKLELRNWDKGACPFIPIRAAAGPYFQFLYKKSP